jgi:hypothetical protein
MRQYRYAIVIENESSYLTEKLFDALRAGCLPVYVGLDPLPPDLEALVVRSLPNVPCVLAAMEVAKQRDRSNWESQVRKYFLGSSVRAHSITSVATRTAEAIAETITLKMSQESNW